MVYVSPLDPGSYFVTRYVTVPLHYPRRVSPRAEGRFKGLLVSTDPKDIAST